MKKIFFLLFILAALGACKHDELLLFDKKPDAYFWHLDDTRIDRAGDTTYVDFNTLSGTEYPALIPVQVTGALSDAARTVAYEVVAEKTTAKNIKDVPGKADTVHYTAGDIVISAGQIMGYLPVTFYRTPDLSADEITYKLTVRLLPNEHFGTDYQTRLYDQANDRYRSVLEYSFYLSDYLKAPKWWLPSGSFKEGDPVPTNEDYFGAYSKKKYLLICQVNGFPPAYMNGGVWEETGSSIESSSDFILNLIPAAKRTQIYLNQEELADRTVYEEDGVTKMEMGRSGKP